MKEQLENIYNSAKSDIEKAQSISDIDEIRLKYLSRKGEFNSIKKGLKDLSDEDKRVVGALANQITQDLEGLLREKHEVFYRKELNEKLQKDRIDITLNGKFIPQGKVHPLTSTTNEIVTIFQNLGFSVVSPELSPEVETEYYNFDMLNVPKDHPARDEQDTFFINDSILLRSQTSPVQARTMEKGNLPIRMIAPGRVFRSDEVDATHSPSFHQIEGLVIDKNITFADLKGTLQEFAQELFGPETKTKFRPHHFPFTEPSAEVDVSCFKCGGKGCRFCKGSGWIEILGCGTVHPNVLRMCGIDPDEYTGFAFGVGLERIALLKYEIDDMRLLYENDIRFLKQF